MAVSGPLEGRASIEGATVTLRKVTQEDAGEYRCEISAPLDSVSLGETNVTLRVLGKANHHNISSYTSASQVLLTFPVPCPSVPPQTPSCDIPSSAVTGSVVQLRCRDQHSIPPATYSWYKDNQRLSTSPQPNATYAIDPHTGVLVSMSPCSMICKG